MLPSALPASGSFGPAAYSATPLLAPILSLTSFPSLHLIYQRSPLFSYFLTNYRGYTTSSYFGTPDPCFVTSPLPYLPACLLLN
jgi:hypothetical protein